MRKAIEYIIENHKSDPNVIPASLLIAAAFYVFYFHILAIIQ